MQKSKLKLQLTVMNYLQFFVWGSWLISLGGYMMSTLHFSGMQVGSIYATMGIASLFMPGVVGIIADKYINAEKLLGILHLIGACILIALTRTTSFGGMYPLMLLLCMCYMPTIA
ncbi:MAG: MFS transporter, partial [Porphyromonadaceae bacterium]|nr:MFS transporter [Porphyromonadaceae bacterium]